MQWLRVSPSHTPIMASTARTRVQGLTLLGRPSKTRKPRDPLRCLFSKTSPAPAPSLKLNARGSRSRLYSVRAASKDAAGIDLAGTTAALLAQSLMSIRAKWEAEEQIARLAGDPQVVSTLVQHLRTDQNPDLRQHAAEFLGENIAEHWDDLPLQTKQLLKDSLVASMTTEESPSVRRAIADVVSAVPAGDWPDLVPFLFQCCQSPEEDHREAALILFGSLKETTLRPYASDMLEFASGSSQHTNSVYREFSVRFLGEIAKACPQLMKIELERVLNTVLVALWDSVQAVRLAASNVLREFAWYLQPEILSQYRTVLPCILNSLEDNESDREIMENLYHALAEFSEDLRYEQILPFLDRVMNRLFSAIQCGSRDLQQKGIHSISLVAVKTKLSFMPYAERVLELMKPLMVLTRDEDLPTRLAATQLVGGVTYSTLRKAEMDLALILAPYVEAAISGFSLGHSQLRQYTHRFFILLAESVCSGDEFVKYLPDVVPLAFSSCNLDDGSAVLGYDFSDEIAEVDEKVAAIQALGVYARCAKSSYAPYLEQSLKNMIKQSATYQEDVRLEAITGLRNMLTAAASVYGSRDDGPAKTKEVLGTMMNIYIEALKQDDNEEVVARVCNEIGGIVDDHGYAALDPYAPQILELVIAYISSSPRSC